MPPVFQVQPGEPHDEDENTKLASSFRVAFQRWACTSNFKSNIQVVEPANEDTQLANSYRAAFAHWTPPSGASKSTSYGKKGATAETKHQSQLSAEVGNRLSETTRNESHVKSPSLKDKSSTTIRKDEELQHGTVLDYRPQAPVRYSMVSSDVHEETSKPSSRRLVSKEPYGMPKDHGDFFLPKTTYRAPRPSPESENTGSFKSDMSINGDDLPIMLFGQFRGRQKRNDDFGPIPEEKLMKTEEASAELKAEIKALQDSFRDGSWYAKSRKQKEKKKHLGSGADTYYVVERPGELPMPGYFDIPQDVSEAQKERVRYTLYEASVPAYPRLPGDRALQQGAVPRVPDVKTGIPAFETVPPVPSSQQILRLLAWEGHRRITKHQDLDHGKEEYAGNGADWCYFRHSFEGGRVAFSEWLWTWLDITIYHSWIADIYHEPFFDGTAHADGMRGFYVILEPPEQVIIPPHESELDLYDYVEKQDSYAYPEY